MRVSKGSKPVQELTRVGWGQLLYAIASLAGVRALTEFMSPASYGEYALAMTLVTFVHQTVYGPLSAALGRQYAIANAKTDVPGLMSAWIKVSVWLAAGALFLGLVFGGTAWALELDRRAVLFLPVAVLLSIANGIDSNAEALANAGRRRRLVMWHQAARGLLRFGLAAGAALASAGSAIYALSGYLLGSAAVAGSNCRRVFSGYRSKKDPHRDISATSRELRSFAWPITVWGAFIWFQFASDRWALQMFAGTREVGLYNAVFQIGYYPVALASGILLAYVSPIVYERARGGAERAEVRRLVRLAVVATVAGTALLVVCSYWASPLIASLLVGPHFREAVLYLPAIILAAGLFACGQLLALMPLAAIDTRTLLMPTSLAALGGGLLTFVLAHRWALAGVVTANVAYGIFHCVGAAYASTRITQTRDPQGW